MFPEIGDLVPRPPSEGPPLPRAAGLTWGQLPPRPDQVLVAWMRVLSGKTGSMGSIGAFGNSSPEAGNSGENGNPEPDEDTAIGKPDEDIEA